MIMPEIKLKTFQLRVKHKIRKQRTVTPQKLKPIRKFNGKVYVRLASYENENQAKLFKEKLKAKGHYVTLIKSGPNTQIWIRKGK